MGLAQRTGAVRTRTGPRDAALREARICYDHLAGERGVLLLQGLIARGWIDEAETNLTASGRAGLTDRGLDVASLERGRRPVCRYCLDWRRTPESSRRRARRGSAAPCPRPGLGLPRGRPRDRLYDGRRARPVSRLRSSRLKRPDPSPPPPRTQTAKAGRSPRASAHRSRGRTRPSAEAGRPARGRSRECRTGRSGRCAKTRSSRPARFHAGGWPRRCSPNRTASVGIAGRSGPTG